MIICLKSKPFSQQFNCDKKSCWPSKSHQIHFHDKFQGCNKGQKSGGAGSNAARRRCPAAPSDLPKSGGGAAAPPAPTLAASLYSIHFFVS